jgi:hypothetical protein
VNTALLRLALSLRHPALVLSFSIRRTSARLKHCPEHYTAFTRMARLDHAITALDLLGSVVQAVPVVGENLKSATEVTKKICEMVKVRMVFSFSYMLDIPCRR